MIEGLEIVDDDLAIAAGEKYELRKVLDAAEDFLRAFVANVAMAAPGSRAIVRFNHDDELPLDDAGYEAIRAFYVRAAKRHDVIDATVSAIVGPFRVSLRLLGDDDLFLKEGEDEPTTISGAPWPTLSTEPNLVVMPAGGSNPLFQFGSTDAVHALVRAAAPAGTDAAGVSSLPGLRFPHAVFGAGRGTLRVALLRVPADDPPEDPGEAP